MCQVSQQVLDRYLAKNIKMSPKAKTSASLVDILHSKAVRNPLQFDQKNQLVFHLKLVGTTCSNYKRNCYFISLLLLSQLKSLEAKHELLQEDSKKILFYLQAILVAFLSIAFMTTLIWYSFKEQHDNSACNCMSTTTENTFQFEKPSDHRPSFEQEL